MNVCEGTGSNIFCVFGEQVLTPPLDAGPLAGITRELLLEWCSIVERDLTPAEAAAADEVFITSSLRDVQAVSRWDDSDLRPPARYGADRRRFAAAAPRSRPLTGADLVSGRRPMG